MDSIKQNIERIKYKMAEAAIHSGRSPDEVKLMAVTKTQTAQGVNEAINCGITLLGENRAQELIARYDDYNRETAEIHFIGKLQTNKVKQIINKVTMVQSVDSLKLAEEINTCAEKFGVKMDVLIEVNTGEELTKAGILPNNVLDFARSIATYNNLNLRGLMTIPPPENEIGQNEKFFYLCQQLFVDIKGKIVDNRSIDILSMGMSDDFTTAIKHGSTLVRIGSAIFGARQYI